jgi:RNase P subunit RPR2
MKMEQTMRQISEMISVAEAVISTNPKEVQAHYVKMEPLLTRLWTKREEDIKATEAKSCTNCEKMVTECEAD